MRLRLGLLIAAVFATLLNPIAPTAQAFGGYASAPLSVSSTAIAGGLRVTWSAPTDVDTGVTGYRVEYSTSGTSGDWTLSTTANSSTYTYDILGLSQVATYVRVAATTSAGVGTYGYPWTKLYSTIQRQRNSDGTIQYESGFGLGASDPYTTLQAASFTRVRYLFNTTLTSNGTTNYADVDFYKWANTGNSTQTTNASSNATIRTLSIPTITGTTHIVQANVSDMNVFSDNDNATDARGINGRLELWGIDYGFSVSGLTGAGSSGSFDYDDTPAAGSYGSFQVHNISTLQPVFVWNHHTYGYNADLNYGINSTPGSQPDSTFCGQNDGNGTCPARSAFKLQIFANIPVTPLADATPPTVSRMDARSIGKNGDTITVRSTELGTVYLVNQSVTVSNLASITSASAANKNSVSISTVNTNTTLALSGLNDGLYNLYAADPSSNLSTGLLATIRIDNTAPTISSISVSSAGTSIALVVSETITNSSQVYNTYVISDSGSAISVNGTTFSGNTAVFTLSRAIPAGATVYFSYTPSGGAASGRWVDQAGNELAAISTRTISNNSSAAITVTLSVADPLYKGSSVTISASVSVAGKVTFTIANKRIAGCLNKIASGTTPITVTCTFKPALTARQTIKATLVPTLGAYPTKVASVDRFILKRTTPR
jgi:hypothetical protein